MSENKIFVIYIGIIGIRSEDISDYIHKIASRIIPQTFSGEIILIPTNSVDTRIECINPEYISKKNLIEKHNKLMEDLNIKLQDQIKYLNKKDEFKKKKKDRD